MSLPVRSVHWKSCWRIIPSCYPTENLFHRIADDKDLTSVAQLDELTSTRLREERGEMGFIGPGERVKGPGSRYVMASFSYSFLNPSRFSDGSYGVYYGAKDIHTAIEETKYHRAEFMRHTHQKPMRLPMRGVVCALKGHLHDLRGLKRRYPGAYSPASYSQSQALGRKLRFEGSTGIIYDSVRHPAGQCAAIFKPSVLSHCRQERNLEYEWDGHKISKVFELHEYVKVR